ncbi:sigma-54 interaction domain-containing protein [Nitrospinota bacterium]
MELRVLVLDDHLDSMAMRIRDALDPYLKEDQKIPDLAGGVSEPFDLLVEDTSIRVTLASNRENRADTVANSIKSGEFIPPFDLVLLDDFWTDDDFGGQNQLLKLILDKVTGVSPELPVVILFTDYWDERWEEFVALRGSISSLTALRVTGFHKRDIGRLRMTFHDVILRKMLIEQREEERKIRETYTGPGYQQEKRDRFGELIGGSPGMREVYSFINKVSRGNSTVLITGENGTGKDLVARAIHYEGHRKESPFIPINCSAIPEPLFESVLFGYEKGVFTGATDRRKGHFEDADKGTLFLDEIGAMPLVTQPKLLRVLEGEGVNRLGGSKNIKVDVRLIVATNSDLRAMVRDKTFREDLYYRVNVMSIHLPPLRERTEDIPLLVNFFLDKHYSKTQRSKPSYDMEFIRELKSFSWPGNVRELENVIEKALTLVDAHEWTVSTARELLLWGENKDPQECSIVSTNFAECSGVHRDPTTSPTFRQWEIQKVEEFIDQLDKLARIHGASYTKIAPHMDPPKKNPQAITEFLKDHKEKVRNVLDTNPSRYLLIRNKIEITLVGRRGHRKT